MIDKIDIMGLYQSIGIYLGFPGINIAHEMENYRTVCAVEHNERKVEPVHRLEGESVDERIGKNLDLRV